jgi:hypothetical protein
MSALRSGLLADLVKTVDSEGEERICTLAALCAHVGDRDIA